MSPRKKKVTPRVSPKARRAMDEMAKQILAGDEGLEIRMMQKVYGKPIETELEPRQFPPMPEDEIPGSAGSGARCVTRSALDRWLLRAVLCRVPRVLGLRGPAAPPGLPGPWSP